jgi:hypothetical protein
LIDASLYPLLLPLSGFFVDMTERESGVRRSFRVGSPKGGRVTVECVNTSGKPGRQRRAAWRIAVMRCPSNADTHKTRGILLFSI